MAIAISIQNVSKSFHSEEILHGISHDFEKGQIHGIVGNNGSGKTVLMKCICGYLLPSDGRIFVDGKQVGKDVDFPEDIGVIIETPGFLPNISGIKNLQILASLRRKITNDTIRQTLRCVGLDLDMKKSVSKYSLGMRQRLGIAQAIMESPSILILDEPFNGLDKIGARQMRDLIKGLRKEGKTILLASHNQMDIDELCDTVCEMDAGTLTVVRAYATANKTIVHREETKLGSEPKKYSRWYGGIIIAIVAAIGIARVVIECNTRNTDKPTSPRAP